MPKKSGIDAVPWLGFWANAADENRVATAVVATIHVSMMVPLVSTLPTSPRGISQVNPRWNIQHSPALGWFAALNSQASARTAGSPRLNVTPISGVSKTSQECRHWATRPVCRATGAATTPSASAPTHGRKRFDETKSSGRGRGSLHESQSFWLIYPAHAQE